jgi:hypothetical protein
MPQSDNLREDFVGHVAEPEWPHSPAQLDQPEFGFEIARGLLSIDGCG